ncbi:MAG: helix-turn-helix transcriptional regulator [Sulfuritalea sp.]|nr:helix-turn-helix transcriptional regulator [Sulfuritalea sp.]MDP1981124.1 helix-turn-helix transcriptional regulator [Sulfuritalea sp.]MDZ4252255.1 helix-turn-helix transcriptional regulator [Sulfuritalea sp.]
MSDTTIFSRRLREARLRSGLSQMALGVAAGIDESSASPRINQYERGKHHPDALTAARLARVLKVPSAYFAAEDDDLAELLALWDGLEPEQKRRLLVSVREMSSS